MKPRLPASLALALIASSASAPALAAESYDNCSGFIDSLPAVIATQGTWCVRKDLATSITSGDAILVTTNNVTVDCNHFKLGGLSAGLATEATGVNGTGRSNVTVRNCNVRGFYNGVWLGGGSTVGNLVEDSRFDGNTRIGIRVEGEGSVVRRNLVNDTGGSTVQPAAIGIGTTGSVDVIDNSVFGVYPDFGTPGADIAYGIYTFNNFLGVVSSNRVRQLVPMGGGVGHGIYNQSEGRVIVRGNDVIGDGSASSIGIRCFDSTASARDNVTSNFTTGVSGCGNDGGNVHKN